MQMKRIYPGSAAAAENAIKFINLSGP